MLKKTITFDDLDGNSVTEDFYFNLSKAEMLEMSADGYEAVLQKMIDAKSTSEMLKHIRDLIGKAVGRRSEDGKRFIKTPEIRDEFLQSEAFSELFMELATDGSGTKATEFFAGLMPKGLVEKAQATILPVDPPKIEENDGLMNLSREELLEKFKKQQAERNKTE